MWRVSDADSQIYLFGTFHLLPKSATWTTPAYKAAMAQAKITVVECDTASAYAKSTIGALVLERGMNPSYETLRDVVGSERFAKLAELGERYGVNKRSLQRMRPWLATMSVSLAAMTAAGFNRGLGVERVVLADAKAEGDKFAFLETVEMQIMSLASLDGPDMLANVDLTIAQLGNFKEEMEPMLAAWLKGDLAALDRLSSDDMRRTAPNVYKAVLVDRNTNWTKIIERWVAQKGDYFIAVGAAHLTGKDSVIAMLQKKGLKVERIQ